jgi:hypothetical protein
LRILFRPPEIVALAYFLYCSAVAATRPVAAEIRYTT